MHMSQLSSIAKEKVARSMHKLKNMRHGAGVFTALLMTSQK